MLGGTCRRGARWALSVGDDDEGAFEGLSLSGTTSLWLTFVGANDGEFFGLSLGKDVIGAIVGLPVGDNEGAFVGLSLGNEVVSSQCTPKNFSLRRRWRVCRTSRSGKMTMVGLPVGDDGGGDMTAATMIHREFTPDPARHVALYIMRIVSYPTITHLRLPPRRSNMRIGFEDRCRGGEFRSKGNRRFDGAAAMSILCLSPDVGEIDDDDPSSVRRRGRSCPSAAYSSRRRPSRLRW